MKPFMENSNSSYSDTILDQLKTLQAYIENIKKYTTEEGIKEGGEELWDMAKDFLDKN